MIDVLRTIPFDFVEQNCTELQARAFELMLDHNNQSVVAEHMHVSRRMVFKHLSAIIVKWDSQDLDSEDFEVEPGHHEEEEPFDDLLARRLKAFERKKAARQNNHLINIKINLEGPIGICVLGDPHVDDDGCDLGAILEHADILNNTPGMFAANIGDTTNNWVGRLGRLYGQQGTTESEAWRMAEWFMGLFNWLYLIGGNHDVWSGTGDPLKYIMRLHGSKAVQKDHGCRLNLIHPNGAETRVNSRHDFHGHSQWNNAHGPMKAVRQGWRDHIAVCGHKHSTGIGVLKDPASGLISHAARVATFKRVDRYADELGLMDEMVSPSMTFIIDPSEPDDSPGRVVPFHCPKKAAAFLTYLRQA